MNPSDRSRMSTARTLSLAISAAALAMLLASGPGTRLGIWPWQAGLALLKWAVYTGAAGAAIALALLLPGAVPRWRAGIWMPLLALCLALAAVAPPLILLAEAKKVPPIHDITTDTADPPAFVALAGERAKWPNGAAYGGAAIAAQQARAYPDLKPLVVKGDPRETLQRAIDAARAMGWEVVASDAASGRIEATARTFWFGFRDDVVVRIRPEGGGSRVDVRSVSRVGKSDIGTNAKRVREFLARLA
jgi:uncharacterized protein (DUF1499 family)